MEPICYNQSTSPPSRYQSFITGNLKSLNQCGTNELRGRQIRACFHGWVILSNHPDSVLWSLWNPHTSKLIRLPPLTFKERDSYECCLSSPPGDQGSVFLLLSDTTPTIVFCQLDRKRKRLKWTEMSYAKQLLTISGINGVQLVSPTCYNGYKVYAMTNNVYYDFIIQLNIVFKGTTQVVISLLPFVEAPHALYDRFPSRNSFYKIQSFLKGSCTELFYIRVFLIDETRIGGVSLCKHDMTSMMWEKVEDLKDAIFFVELSTCSVFYKSVAASEIGGYVHILDDMDKIIYSFYVKDRIMSLSSIPCSVQQSQVLVWTMLESGFDVNHPESKQEENDKHKNKDIELVIRPNKPDVTAFDSITTQSRLLNVPFHILEMIMERCVGVEYMKIRTTCKRCYLASPPIQWSNETTLRRWQKYSVVSPWLMVLDVCRGIITFIDPICGDKYFINTPQELKGDCKICCSRYGWLLIHKYGIPNLWFFNPFTSNIRKLPAVPCCPVSICFSAPPTSTDCIVAIFSRLHVYIHFVSQEPSWRKYELDSGSKDLYFYPVPTFDGQDMYVLCNNERIEAVRDMCENDYSKVVVIDKVPRSCDTSSIEYFLSKCDQHLLLVVAGKFRESVEVFKLNDDTKEWEKLDSLGKHMIYISYASCICLEAKSSDMENKIYFPGVLHSNDTKIVFYSLETCRFHTLDDKNIQESFGVSLSDTMHHCNPHTWIEPSWS